MSELAISTAVTPAADEPSAQSALPATEQATVWAVASVAALVATAISAVALGLYHFLVAPVPPRLATVDLTEIVAVREMQAMIEASKSGGDPQATLRAATLWPQELERTLAAIQADCQCVLLVRAAVIGQQLTDFTPELKKRLGLDKLDAAELRRTLGNTLFASPRAATNPVNADGRPAPAPGFAPPLPYNESRTPAR